MSKPKRRNIARRKRRKRNKLGYDTHHIFFQKRRWDHGVLKILRNHWYCKIKLPKETLHKQIHDKIKTVPVAHELSVACALEQISILEKRGAIAPDDSIEQRLVLLIALFECIEEKTADALKKQLEIVREFKGP